MHPSNEHIFDDTQLAIHSLSGKEFFNSMKPRMSLQKDLQYVYSKDLHILLDKHSVLFIFELLVNVKPYDIQEVI